MADGRPRGVVWDHPSGVVKPVLRSQTNSGEVAEHLRAHTTAHTAHPRTNQNNKYTADCIPPATELMKNGMIFYGLSLMSTRDPGTLERKGLTMSA